MFGFFFQNWKFQSQLEALLKTTQTKKKNPKQTKIPTSYLEYITNIVLTLPEHSLHIFQSKIISGIQCDLILSGLILFPEICCSYSRRKGKTHLVPASTALLAAACRADNVISSQVCVIMKRQPWATDPQLYVVSTGRCSFLCSLCPDL